MSIEQDQIYLLNSVADAFHQAGAALSAAVAPHIAGSVSGAGNILRSRANEVQDQLNKRLAEDQGPKAVQLREIDDLIKKTHDVLSARETGHPLIADMGSMLTAVIEALRPRRYSTDARMLAIAMVPYFPGRFTNLVLEISQKLLNHGGVSQNVTYLKPSTHHLYTGNANNPDRLSKLGVPVCDVSRENPLARPEQGYSAFHFLETQDNGSVVKTILREDGHLDVTVEYNSLEGASHKGHRNHFNSDLFLTKLKELTITGNGGVPIERPSASRETFIQTLKSLQSEFPVRRHLHECSKYRFGLEPEGGRERSGETMRALYRADYGLGEDADVPENTPLRWVLRFRKSGDSHQLLDLYGVDDNLLSIHAPDGDQYRLVSEEEFLTTPLEEATRDKQNIVHITCEGWDTITAVLQTQWHAMVVRGPAKEEKTA